MIALKNLPPNFPSGQRWAWLSHQMFDQMAFEESQKNTPPFTMAQPDSFFVWVDGHGRVVSKGELKRTRKCAVCPFATYPIGGYSGNGMTEVKAWLLHEDTCEKIQSLAVRTIQRMIEQNHKMVPETLTRYPIEMNTAAKGLLGRIGCTPIVEPSNPK